MSPLLKQFFLEIHEWIEQGCPEHKAFSNQYGLCTNLTFYNSVKFGFNLKSPSAVDYELREFLKTISGGSIPFNEDIFSYRKEQRRRTIYQNLDRLAFIKKQVELIKNA